MKARYNKKEGTFSIKASEFEMSGLAAALLEAALACEKDGYKATGKRFYTMKNDITKALYKSGVWKEEEVA